MPPDDDAACRETAAQIRRDRPRWVVIWSAARASTRHGRYSGPLGPPWPPPAAQSSSPGWTRSSRPPGPPAPSATASRFPASAASSEIPPCPPSPAP